MKLAFGIYGGGLDLPGKKISHDALHTRGVDLPVDLPSGRPNLNTLCNSCFASQRSFRFYERPMIMTV